MRVALIGRTEIMYDLVEVLRANNHQIGLISTSKEAPEYTKTAKDFEKLAQALNIPYLYAPRISTPENVDFIKSLKSMDIAISVNHTSIVEDCIIDLFPYGVLNIHGGDLPRYRGNACQAWAIINAESKIGLCVHKMQGGSLDSGDIIVREYLPIDIHTKVTQCWEWIEQRAPYMFLEALRLLEQDKDYVLQKQSTNPKDILRCYPRKPEDGRIDWNASNESVLRLINASNHPYAGAFCFYKEKKLIIWDAELYLDSENYLAQSGQVCLWDDLGVVVICGSGKIRIKEVEYEGEILKASCLLHSIRDRLV
ncbi:methionyl-tRNA formyltransferase [Helicobacter mesocricetorum]|uniref:methionyl-tRNA formyltransferase n=1 Tax=Helicobacter mesocricetorum TaxID=87012 RepID=UPI000CF1B220|nr:formyltransferase family protein [Helicobacter mesocricetorum]